MKKLFVVLFVCSGLAYAEPSGKTALLPYVDTVILGVNTAEISTILVSSFTPTQIVDANTVRKGLVIRNDSGFSLTISTWSTTVTATQYMILTASEFSDLVNPYTGAWYGLFASTNSAKNIKVFEKY